MYLGFLITGSLFFLGHALRRMFQITKIPDLLILTLFGFIAGPILGWINPADLGQSGQFLSEMALVAILLEGGFTLKFSLFREHAAQSLKISGLTFVTSFIMGGVSLMLLTPLPLPMAIYAGFCLGSTSSAIVIPMLKFLTAPDHVKTVLTLESALTDVLVIVSGLFWLDVLAGGDLTLKGFVSQMFNMTIASVASGVVFGLALAVAKKHYPQIANLRFSTVAAVFLIYGLMGMMGFNGALAVLALGMTLGNLPNKKFENLFPIEQGMTHSEHELLGELIFLLKIFFFIYLGALVRFTNLSVVLISVLLTVLLILGRYLCVRLSAPPKRTSRTDAVTLFSMFPRGLACAVVASLPLQKGIAQGDLIQNYIFATVPLTIIGTSVFSYLAQKSGGLEALFPSYPESLAAEPETNAPQL